MKTGDPQEGSEGSDGLDLEAWDLLEAELQSGKADGSREKAEEAEFGGGNGIEVGSREKTKPGVEAVPDELDWMRVVDLVDGVGKVTLSEKRGEVRKGDVGGELGSWEKAKPGGEGVPDEQDSMRVVGLGHGKGKVILSEQRGEARMGVVGGEVVLDKRDAVGRSGLSGGFEDWVQVEESDHSEDELEDWVLLEEEAVCVDGEDERWEVIPCEWEEEMDKLLSAGKDELSSVGIKHASVELFARALFYPTVMFNSARSLIDKDFHWFDCIDKDIWIGAVPFPSHVPRLKDLGITGVVTLTEKFETLVKESTYKKFGIKHLSIPTTDYVYAPSGTNIRQALEFIHKHARQGGSTLVHCKAGRARSATIVLCYLVEYKNMTPEEALARAKTVRKRVKLAPAQWQAVKEFSSGLPGCRDPA